MDMHASSYKILLYQNLVNLLGVFLFLSKYTFNCEFIDGNGSVNITIDVSCVMPYTCITFKTNNTMQDAFVTEPFCFQ